jgi:hypothetical protein
MKESIYLRSLILKIIIFLENTGNGISGTPDLKMFRGLVSRPPKTMTLATPLYIVDENEAYCI